MGTAGLLLHADAAGGGTEARPPRLQLTLGVAIDPNTSRQIASRYLAETVACLESEAQTKPQVE